MNSKSTSLQTDCVVVGAGFSGIACATTLARAGAQVTVLERKLDPGEKLHTTGIIVKDAIDQIALLDELPPELTRRIDGVRLYAPNLRHVDLQAPGYYFLATDTPNVMRWLATRAEQAGVHIAYGASFIHAERTRSGFHIPGAGATRFLIGADGPNSLVAKSLGLGKNTQFLFGIEYEFADMAITAPDRLHCFIDQQLAPGYIGWVVAGVGAIQVGLARRVTTQQPPSDDLMAAFLEKISPIFDFRGIPPTSVRAGMIPCGGLVQRVTVPRALLVGDAAGMVSPVTAGGIHTALKHGAQVGHAVADFLNGKCDDPVTWLTQAYPQFIAKRLLRYAFDHLQSDLLFNLLLGTRFMRTAAEMVYFHRAGYSGRRRHPLADTLGYPLPAKLQK